MSPAPIPVVKPGQKPPPFSELKAMFAYDTSEPFAMKLQPRESAKTEYGKRFQLLLYQSGGELAGGFLVLPEGQGPFPVVVYANGLTMPAMYWSWEAVAMAKRGYAALLLEEPSIGFNSFDAPADIAAYVLYATQERRALDLLPTIPEIDTSRIGFVGYSNGAFLGSLLAGLEDRIKAYVFLGLPGTTTYTAEEKESLGAPTGAEFDRWAAQMSVIDNVAYIGRNTGAKMLFINGKTDVNAMHVAKAVLAAAPKGSIWHLYEGGHFDRPLSATKFWMAWMEKNL